MEQHINNLYRSFADDIYIRSLKPFIRTLQSMWLHIIKHIICQILSMQNVVMILLVNTYRMLMLVFQYYFMTMVVYGMVLVRIIVAVIIIYMTYVNLDT